MSKMSEKNMIFDSVKIHLATDRSMRSYDKNKHLIVDSTVITKACVNQYLGKELDPDGSRGLDQNKVYDVLRDPIELQKALDTFKQLQLTIKHIAVDADKPEKEHTVGSLGSVIDFDGERVSTSLRVWDGDAIRLIESGELEELSAGYSYDLDMTGGEYKGTKYDAIMRNIHGNHVALVDRGRIGRDALIKDELPKQLRNKMKLKKNGYSKIASAIKKTFAMDEDIPMEKVEEIIDAIEENIENPVVEDEDDDKKDDKKTTANDEDNDKDDDKKSDAEDEDDDEDDKKDKKSTAMDADLLRKQITQELHQRHKEAHEALTAVEPVMGKMAYDSAENVYCKTLKHLGINYKGKDLEAMKLLVQSEIKAQSRPSVAMDSINQFEEIPDAFKNIKIG